VSREETGKGRGGKKSGSRDSWAGAEMDRNRDGDKDEKSEVRVPTKISTKIVTKIRSQRTFLCVARDGGQAEVGGLGTDKDLSEDCDEDQLTQRFLRTEMLQK